MPDPFRPHRSSASGMMQVVLRVIVAAVVITTALADRGRHLRIQTVILIAGGGLSIAAFISGMAARRHLVLLGDAAMLFSTLLSQGSVAGGAIIGLLGPLASVTIIDEEDPRWYAAGYLSATAVYLVLMDVGSRTTMGMLVGGGIFAASVGAAWIARIRRVTLETAYDELMQRYASIGEISSAIRGAVRLEEVLDRILFTISRRLHYDRAFIYTAERKGVRETLSFLCGIGVAEHLLEKRTYSIGPATTATRDAGGDGIIPRTYKSRETNLVRNAPDNHRCDQELVELLELGEFLCVPLVAKDRAVGVIVVDNNRSGRPISDEDQADLQTFANHAAMAIESARLYEAMERLSILDELTGAFNHRYFQKTLDLRIEESRRYQRSVSLLIMDIDRFKTINDTYGHPQGDAVLREMVQVLKNRMRMIDTVARYGGDEFVVLLPGTSREDAIACAEDIRRQIEEMEIAAETGEEIPVKVSIGVAEFPIDGGDKEALVSCADNRLYRAKRAGRNCVCAGEEVLTH